MSSSLRIETHFMSLITHMSFKLFKRMWMRLFILMSSNCKRSLNAFKKNNGECVYLRSHHASIQKYARTPAFVTKTHVSAFKMRLVITWWHSIKKLPSLFLTCQQGSYQKC